MKPTASQQFILALDQGTTSSPRHSSSRVTGASVATAQQEFPQYYPQAGWVEHDAGEIWQTQLAVARSVLRDNGIGARQIAAVGVTNQRETSAPVGSRQRPGAAPGNRLAGPAGPPGPVMRCARAGHGELFRQRTGLVLDAYFAGTKLKWLLDQHPRRPGACRARRTGLRDGRQLARLAAFRRSRTRHRRVERLAHPAL
jgi:glycerol kinase